MTNVEFEELEVLLEPRVDLYDLSANEFDFRENFVDMGWMEYFSAEKKPIYTELVKEFWMNARVNNGSIYGCVQGMEAIISLQSLPQIINCYAEGVKFSDEWDDEEIKEELQGIIFEKPNGKSYSDLNPEYKVLYKIISGCILPLRNSSEIVTRSYKFIMWHFAKKISINLPELILDFLKRASWTSKSGKVKTIPLGRVISGCLETFGIIDSLQRSKDFSILQALKPSFGPLFNHITLARLKVRSCDVVERLLKEDEEAKRREGSAKPTRQKRKVKKSVASDSTRRVTRRRAIDELPSIGTSPILSVIFPEDNEEVVLEYRKIVAEDFLRANPNYIPRPVQYEDYDDDNKDEVREYMKKRSASSSNQVPSKKTKVLDFYESPSSTIPQPSEPEHIVQTKFNQPKAIEPQINQSPPHLQTRKVISFHNEIQRNYVPPSASASNYRKEFVASSSGIPKEPLESDHPATSRSSAVVTSEELSKIVQQQQEFIAFMATSNQRNEDITNSIKNLTSLVQKILDKP